MTTPRLRCPRSVGTERAPAGIPRPPFPSGPAASRRNPDNRGCGPRADRRHGTRPVPGIPGAAPRLAHSGLVRGRRTRAPAASRGPRRRRPGRGNAAAPPPDVAPPPGSRTVGGPVFRNRVAPSHVALSALLRRQWRPSPASGAPRGSSRVVRTSAIGSSQAASRPLPQVGVLPRTPALPAGCCPPSRVDPTGRPGRVR